MTFIDGLGGMAAALTTIAFVPQVALIWKTRSAKDVSLPMYLLFTIGILLWFAYGVMLPSWPLIVANAITFLLAASVLAMKLRWG